MLPMLPMLPMLLPRDDDPPVRVVSREHRLKRPRLFTLSVLSRLPLQLPAEPRGAMRNRRLHQRADEEDEDEDEEPSRRENVDEENELCWSSLRYQGTPSELSWARPSLLLAGFASGMLRLVRGIGATGLSACEQMAGGEGDEGADGYGYGDGDASSSSSTTGPLPAFVGRPTPLAGSILQSPVSGSMQSR